MDTYEVISSARGILGGLRRTLLGTPTHVPDHKGPYNGARYGVLVIDASPSMEYPDWPPSRLHAAQEAARAYVNRLFAEEPGAHIAVVAYAYRAWLVSKLTPVTQSAHLCRCIDSICVEDSTNITAGLQIALRILRGSRDNNQIILFTDGGHNYGPSPRPVSDRLRGRATVECVGIGGTPQDVDEGLLRYIASPYPDGSKRYRWIGDKEKLVEHFHNLAGRITRA